ncbi:MAG TPA: cytochrome c oxidase subunit II [bacterium]|nr:cytochrome c oxidase subunit II [bacterium]
MEHPGQVKDERWAGRWMSALMMFILVAGVLSFVWSARSYWLLPLASAQGVVLDQLFYVILILTAIPFVIVHLFLGISLWRFPAKGGERAAHWHEHLGAELTWTIVPTIAFIILGVFGEVVWAKIYSAPPANAEQVDVIGRQFEWQFRYPGPDGKFGRTDPKFVTASNPFGMDPSDPENKQNVITVNDLHLILNRPVAVRVTSIDVIHSFSLPNFRVKQDAMPGRTVEVWFTPDKAGNYQIVCAQLCGVGHYTMRGNVIVESQSTFDQWLQSQEK